MPVSKEIINQIKRIIPPLDGSLHKGQSGRVGVLGGALDYTGAPFFAAISALRTGADLSHIICSPIAADVIKSYSPDLIVHPILREDALPDATRAQLEEILSRLHVLVMGPGLGRENYMQNCFHVALTIARSRAMLVVLDADALWAVGQRPSIIKGYKRAVLTPNIVEFNRLCEGVGVPTDAAEEQKAALLSRALGGVTVLQKGAKDIIAVDNAGQLDVDADRVRRIVEVDSEGGLKRCGGQGDVLGGAVGTMLAWAKNYEDGAFGDKTLPISNLPLLAAVGGSMVTRTASKLAYQKQGRALVTEDMISEIGKAFNEVFSGS